jgi:hypothetical protein
MEIRLQAIVEANENFVAEVNLTHLGDDGGFCRRC